MDKDRKKSRSIRRLLLITYVVVGVVPLILLSNIVFKTTEQYYIEERKKELLNQANILSGQIVASNYLFDRDLSYEFNNTVLLASQQGDYRIIVTDAKGTVVGDSNGSEINKTYLIPEVISALDNKDIATQQNNGNIYAVASMVNSRGAVIGSVLIADVPSDITDRMAELQKEIYLMTSIIVVIVIGVVLVFAQTITEPLEKMIKTIQKMADGHLEQRIPINQFNNNEITEVGKAINNMAEKLYQVDVSRQHFVSNVSHELKTPLSSIKVLSESILLNTDAPMEMYKEFLQDITNEVDRMAEIINDLLTLVRLDQKEVPVNFKSENINELVYNIVKRLSPLATHNYISLTYEQQADTIAVIDATKFTLAVSNLIENAIKYTDAGGQVNVIVDCDHQNSFITVSDTGVGMAEDELGKIFDRFYRIDKTRDRETGGTGLGLAITHSTVLMHGGSIKVTSKENEGTTFIIRIPLVH